MTSESTVQRLLGGVTRTPASSPIPLAFTFGTQPPGVVHAVTMVTWSDQGQTLLKQLEGNLRIPKARLPLRALRARIELNELTSLRLDSYLGLGKDRTILWCQAALPQALKTICHAVHGWLVEDLKQALEENEEIEQKLKTLKDLALQQKLVIATRRTADPLKWDTTQGKTAKQIGTTGFPDLADFVARQVEGAEVFTGCGPMRRIAGDELTTNKAELITNPIQIGRGRFSLVLRFTVLTFPGHSKPVVKMDVSRRVWVTSLKQNSLIKRVKGYALPLGLTRAFPFTVERVASSNEKTPRFQFGREFTPIARKYIERWPLSVDEVLTQGHTFKECVLLVNLRHGASARSSIKSGVPDLDKLEAFEAVTKILAKSGLSPWTDVELVEKLPNVDSMGQDWTDRDEEDPEKVQQYQDWLKEAEDSIRKCYRDQYHLLIGIQRDGEIDADAKEAQRRLEDILGPNIHVDIIPLPSDVHGPRNKLPGASLKSAERAELRMQAWQPFIERVRAYGQTHRVDGIMIIARRWYGNESPKPDDAINKRAGRIALARALKVPVQYLLPRSDIEEENEEKRIKIDNDFEQRLMMAWLDLAYKTIGRVQPGKLLEKAQTIYATNQLSFLSTYPERIIGLGVVRRNRNHLIKNESSFMPYAIELDVESGTCLASFAYEDPETRNLAWSDMLPLPQTLVALASKGPVQIYRAPLNATEADYRKNVSERSQAFFKAILAARCRNSHQPFIIVDADTSRYVWPWLRDETIDPKNIHISGGYNEQSSWPRARFVRVRSNNAPKILYPKEAIGKVADTGEEIRINAPNWAESTLFRLNTVKNGAVYLSFGSFVRRGRIRGRSCYRQLRAFASKKPKNESPYWEVSLQEPFTDAWSTPSALEIMVVRQGQDSPDQVAKLTTWLRQCYAHFGAWTTKPAPLFFEGVLKQYIADFELSDTEEVEEDEENAELVVD